MYANFFCIVSFVVYCLIYFGCKKAKKEVGEYFFYEILRIGKIFSSHLIQLRRKQAKLEGSLGRKYNFLFHFKGNKKV